MSDDGDTSDAERLDLLAVAWGIIANAYGGNWDLASSEWRGAAGRWRDQYFAATDSARAHKDGSA